MLRVVNLTKNAEKDKYEYPGYGFGFDARDFFSLSNGSDFGKSVIIFGVDMGSSVGIDNKKDDILILGAGSTGGLVVITLTAETKIFCKFNWATEEILFKLVSSKGE